MAKTKIDWCEFVWNPVWGCLNNCKFCYARKIAKRFAKNITKKEFDYLERKIFQKPQYFYINSVILYDKGSFYDRLKIFCPTFIVSNFEKSFPKKPSKIFVNSMSEIYYWEKEWMELVLEKIKKYPQHIFMFLTKFPQVYKKYDFPENCWLGITITDVINTNGFKYKLLHWYAKNNIKFISFEPLLKFDSCDFAHYYMSPPPDWIIVGAQTNPYKPPEREWVEKIIKAAKKQNVPVFLKDNLYRAYSDLPILKEFPEIKINN